MITNALLFEVKVPVGVEVLRRANGAQPKQAILELSKGKLTTAQAKHSGEGIFFSSRACDSFVLSSGRLALVCSIGTDFLIESQGPDVAETRGTCVTFAVRLNTDKTMSKVFDESRLSS